MTELSPHQTRDGSLTLFHPDFGETFKSQHAAATEVEEVYLGPGVLENPRLAAGEEFRVLELGFGIATNFLHLWRWRRSAEWAPEIVYLGVDRDLEPARAFLPHLNASEAHRLEDFLALKQLESPGLKAKLVEGEFLATLQALPPEQRFDAVFYDPFSPKSQPDSWSHEIAKEVALRMAPGGRLVTYSVSALAKNLFRELGFQVDRKALSPILQKRQSLVAIWPGEAE